MKKLLIFLWLCAFAFAAKSQVVEFRGDTARFHKNGGSMEIRVENSTRAIKGAAVNVDGKGTIGFQLTQFIDDSLLIIGGDTIVIHASGSGGFGRNLFVGNGIYAPNDSTMFLGVNPLVEETHISGSNNFNFFFDSLQVVYTAPSHSYYLEFVRPNNYNGADQNQFSRWLDDNFVNPVSLRRDAVYSWASYNSTNQGGVAHAGEAAFFFKAETYYDADMTHLFEFHIPEVADDAGVSHRLISLYTHRPDGYTYWQSQIGSFSMRPVWNNSGTWEWFTLGGGAGGDSTTSGTVNMFMNADMGAGDEFDGGTNTVNIFMKDGAGYQESITALGGSLKLTAPAFDIFLTTPRYLRAPSYVHFDQATYTSPNDVFFEGITDATNHGYEFYTDGQLTHLMSLWKNTNISWQQFQAISGFNHYGNYISAWGSYTTNHTLALTEHFIDIPSGGNITMTLPAANSFGFAAVGYQYTLKNSGTDTVTVATAGGGDLIDGFTSYKLPPKTWLTTMSDNTKWIVINGGLASSGSGIGGVSGWDDVLAVHQALSTNRSVDFGSHSLSFNGSGSLLSLVSSGGNAIGILGQDNSAAAASITASGSGNIGAVISSAGNWAVQLAGDRSSTNSVVTLMDIQRTTSNTAGNGIGTAIEFTIENNAGTVSTAHLIESIFTDVTNGSETSKMIILGKFAGASQSEFVLYGNGVWSAPGIANWGNYANNAAAITGGLVAGDLYRNGDVVQVVH